MSPINHQEITALLAALPQPTLFCRGESWMGNQAARELLGTDRFDHVADELPAELTETGEAGLTQLAFPIDGLPMSAHSAPLDGGHLITLQREELARLNMSAVAYNLRSKLAPLSAALQALQTQNQEDTEAAERNFAIANRASYRLIRLSDALALSAELLEQKALPLLRPMDLAAFCQSMRERVTPLFAELGLELEVLTAGPVMVEADTDKLERAVLNLLANAAGNSQAPGTVTLSVMKQGKRALLTVRDNGGGLRAVGREGLFTLPELVEPEGVLSGSGIRLGLYIVRAVAELHGGSVLLTENDGVSVTMNLPLRKAGGELRTPRMEYAVSGGFAPELIEFSDLLPASMYARVGAVTPR